MGEKVSDSASRSVRLELAGKLPASLPRHVAIIMDGNGRWATSKAKSRTEGHRAGAESARIMAECCTEWGIPYLTLYAFSTENWGRPRREVKFLMSQLERFLVERRDEMAREGIRFKAIGRTGELRPKLVKELAKTEQVTSGSTRLTIQLALNYGGRAELVDACRALARKVKEGAISPEDIDEESVARELSTAGAPDPDLLIRSGGEMRVSNFLLWQISYAEIYVTETLWPDFREEALLAALEAYAARHRRFGRVEEGLLREQAQAPARSTRAKSPGE